MRTEPVGGQVPRVSIVTATYNRAEVLRRSIASVLWQTVANWELLVIGDACTDNTAEVVAAFGDARITFVNLPENHGEQSAPNNEGLRRARGRFIAFLNHDDLWFPDHLETALAQLEQDEVDFVHTIGAAIQPDGTGKLIGVSVRGVWHPSMAVPASLMVFERSVVERIGHWRSAWRIWNSPSQDWLFRASKQGIVIGSIPRLTTVFMQSGLRSGSYRGGGVEEADSWLKRIGEYAVCRERLLARIALDQAGRENEPGVFRRFKLFLRAVLFRIALVFGIAPYGMLIFFRFGRKGGLIRRLRRIRGLSAEPGKPK